MAEVGTSVIPDFDRITKLAAPPRFSGDGPGDCAYAQITEVKRQIAIIPELRGFAPNLTKRLVFN
jgi:hypothetical protein